MKILFVADPLHTFKIYKDSTFAMMREAQARGHELWACEQPDIVWQSGGKVEALARRIGLKAEAASDPQAHAHDWFTELESRIVVLAEVDAVLMRKDPPFDAEYLYTTHLLSQAQREGARVFNDPQALREHPEKLSILAYPQFITPTLVTRDIDAVRAFHTAHSDIILKPLDGMGGMGIFRVREDGLNLGSIAETLTKDGQQTIMVQQFLPAIAQGDKRVLLIDGEPVPYALARIPQGGEVRGNLAAGGKGVAQPLSESDLAIAKYLGPILAARGLLLVGLDIIGERLTEINVTSPTCFQEITQQTGWDVAKRFVEALEAKVAGA
jgi:glutathione synthase